MSADLYIHAFPPELKYPEVYLKCFSGHTLGSKYFRWAGTNQCITDPRIAPIDCHHWKAVADSDSIWIGQVSWLKAALFEDDSFIPEPVQAIHELIGEDLPVLDDELRNKILQALVIPNRRAPHYDFTKDEGIVKWLDDHKGHLLFTVSW